MQPHWRYLGLSALVGFLSATLSDAYSFLFISAPTSDAVYASRLLTAIEQSRNEQMTSYQLPGLDSIKKPRGIAVDSLRKTLYIVSEDRNLYAARLYYSNTGSVACEAPRFVLCCLTSLWVAVDFRGKVFIQRNNEMLSIEASIIQKKLNGAAWDPVNHPNQANDALADAQADAAAANDADKVAPAPPPAPAAKDDAVDAGDAGDTGDAAKAGATTTIAQTTTTTTVNPRYPTELVYDGAAVNGVSQPRGIAVDGYRMFWVNGENGEQDGTVVSGFEDPLGDTSVTKITTNLAMAHGVCLTAARVFYTDEEANVFSTKVNGGEPVAVTDKLQKPRGCVFDGDGTVFVADMGDSKVMSFAGAAENLGPRRLSVALSDVKEPFGLAVMHGDRDSLQKAAASRNTAALVSLVLTALTLLII